MNVDTSLADQRELLSAVVALEFVILSGVAIAVSPLDAVLPLLPLLLVLSIALYAYLS